LPRAGTWRRPILLLVGRLIRETVSPLIAAGLTTLASALWSVEIGNANALRHGHYTAEAIARRRQLSELIGTARATLFEIEERR
jgi:hypothetical protein